MAPGDIPVLTLCLVHSYVTTVVATNIAESCVGNGDTSGANMFSTTVVTLPTVPTELSASALSGGSVSVAWNAPLDDGGSPIQSYVLAAVSAPVLRCLTCVCVCCVCVCVLLLPRYTLRYREVASPTNPWLDLATTPPGVRSTTRMVHTQYDLTADTAYEYSVAAVNAVGEGPVATVEATTTAPQPPSQPRNVTAVLSGSDAPTGGAVTLLWDAPLDTGGAPVLQYRLMWRLVFSATTNDGSGLTTTTFIAANTDSTLALENSGVGPTFSGSGWCGATPRCRAYGLTNGTSYEFAVIAVNSAGASSMSNPAYGNATATRSAPGVSPQPTLTDVGGCGTLGVDVPACNPSGGAIQISLSQPLDLGGVASSDDTISYTVAVANSSNPAFVPVFTGTQTTFKLYGLTPSTAYTFKVATSTAAGQGDYGPGLSVTTAAVHTKPMDMPTPSLANATGGQVCLRWDTPLDVGGAGAVLDGYTVFLADTGASGSRAACNAGTASCSRLEFIAASSKDARSYCLAGLSPGTTYGFRMSAHTFDFGEGYVSGKALLSTAAQATAPATIARPQVSSLTATSLRVQWRTPTDTGGGLPLAYQLQVREGTDGFTTTNVTYTAAPASGVGGINTFTLTEYLGTPIANIGGAVFRFRVRLATNAAPGGAVAAWSPVLEVSMSVGEPGHLEFMSGVDVNGDVVSGNLTLSLSEATTTHTFTLVRVGGFLGQLQATISTAVLPSCADLPYTLHTNTSCAAPGLDFQPASDVLTLENGEESVLWNVTLLPDAVTEVPDESFQVVITTDQADGPPLVFSATITVTDDGDAGVFGFVASSYSISESASHANLGLTRTGGRSGAVRVMWVAAAGTAAAGVDFVAPNTPQPVYFADQQDNATLAVPLLNDAAFEFVSEYFSVTLQSIEPLTSGAVLNPSATSATVLITDDGDTSVPGAPPPPTTQLATGGRLELTLVPPTNTGGTGLALTSMKLWKIGADGVSKVLIHAGLGPNVVVNGLSSSTECVAACRRVREARKALTV